MARLSIAQETCPIARAIGVVGDWWTLLILRDALLIGSTRFDQFHRSLGIATNILTRRLAELVDQGLLERVPSDHPRTRFEYRPTEKGSDLLGVLMAFMEWGNRWAADDQAPPVRLTHAECGGHVQADPHCSACGEHMTAAELYLEPLKSIARERARSMAAPAAGASEDGGGSSRASTPPKRSTVRKRVGRTKARLAEKA